MRKLHEFYCKECDSLFESLAEDDERVLDCPVCFHPGKRRISFHGTISVFNEHYNEGLGMHVSSAHQLRDEVKKRGLTIMHPGDKIDPNKQARELRLAREKKTKESIQNYLRSGILDKLENGPLPGVEKFIQKEKEREARETNAQITR